MSANADLASDFTTAPAPGPDVQRMSTFLSLSTTDSPPLTSRPLLPSYLTVYTTEPPNSLPRALTTFEAHVLSTLCHHSSASLLTISKVLGLLPSASPDHAYSGSAPRLALTRNLLAQHIVSLNFPLESKTELLPRLDPIWLSATYLQLGDPRVCEALATCWQVMHKAERKGRLVWTGDKGGVGERGRERGMAQLWSNNDGSGGWWDGDKAGFLVVLYQNSPGISVRMLAEVVGRRFGRGTLGEQETWVVMKWAEKSESVWEWAAALSSAECKIVCRRAFEIAADAEAGGYGLRWVGGT